MMKKTGLMIVLVFATLFDAYGQSVPGVRMTVFGAGSFPSANRTFAVDGNIFNTQYASGPRFGFRATSDLSDRVAFEGAYSFGRSNLRVTEMETPPEMRLFKTNIHQFSGNALYYTPNLGEHWSSFVTGGIGITRFAPTQEAAAFARLRFIDDPATIQTSNQFSVNFGWGAVTRINEWLGFRADFRDHVIPIPRFGLAETSVAYPVRGLTHNLEASAGAVFYLRF